MMCTDDKVQIKRAEAKKVCKNVTGDETGRVGYQVFVYGGAGSGGEGE